MIVLNRIKGDGTTAEMGIPLHNFISCNASDEGKIWVASWDGTKVFRCTVNHTIRQIQVKVQVARHGTAPSSMELDK